MSVSSTWKVLPEAESSTVPAARQGIEITRVVPVVRWAALVKHVPPLDERVTSTVARVMREAWPEWAERYRAAVAERANLPVSELEVDAREAVRYRRDGKTPMVDFPRVRSRFGSLDPIDVRVCAALCVENYSSKFWTRVGPPFGPQRRGYAVQNLPQVLRRYRSLARSCSEWFRHEIAAMADEVLSGRSPRQDGALEVTTVGLYVQGEHSEEELETWLVDSDGRPNFANEVLARFIKQIAGIDYDLREVEQREENAFWMSIPMAVQLPNGMLASRMALYLVRPVGDDIVQVVGVGLDDSLGGEFASDVALKVSRFVANRI
jgi:hypothetical protein